MFGIGKKKKAKIKREVLARLAAQETAALLNKSIEQSSGADMVAACDRVMAVLDLTDDDLKADSEVGPWIVSLVEKMVTTLREADLNINFPANKFFAEDKIKEKYTTKFEVMRTTGAPMGDTRNTAEERMFDYSGFGRVDVNTADPGSKAAALRLEHYGKLNSPGFAGAIRPKYCSVNFPALVDGMGAQWGRSHLVLANHLKPNMTFLHSDSFDVVSGSRDNKDTAGKKMASYHFLQRLIVNMPDQMLAALADAATGYLAKGLTAASFRAEYPLGSTAYIEGQVHAEIYLNRDVAKIRVDKTELEKLPDWQKRVNKFTSRFTVPLEFFR